MVDFLESITRIQSPIAAKRYKRNQYKLPAPLNDGCRQRKTFKPSLYWTLMADYRKSLGGRQSVTYAQVAYYRPVPVIDFTDIYYRPLSTILNNMRTE